MTIALAFLIDLLFGDPPNRWHPVVLMGNWLTAGRRRAPRRQRFWFGVGWIVAGVAIFSLPWRLFGREKRLEIRDWRFTLDNLQSPNLSISSGRVSLSGVALRSLLNALLLKPVFAYRNLRRSVLSVAEALDRGDLEQARYLTGWHLVSRDTRDLSREEVAGAAIESLAENLTDSVTAPLLAYAVGGLPAAWGYRFVNTADAMWGYRTPEFEELGKFAARLDDLLNWLPARLTGGLLVLAAWVTGEDAAQAKTTMLAQHDSTSSPNAGWTMSAMAGALNTTLSKRGVYDLRGGPERPAAVTVSRAVRVADVCLGLGVVGLIAATLFRVRC